MINRVTLMGNLTRDPEIRILPSGVSVATFGIATSRKYKKGDQQQEEITFVDLEAFGRQAEVIGEYARKGKPLFIEGRLRLDQWTDKDGTNRQKLKVVVDNFQFMNDGKKSEGATNAKTKTTKRKPVAEPDGGPAVDEDDIPFDKHFDPCF